jgi:phosphoribosyl 1,2-cyclic phosphate phosphodiesterase
LFAQVLDENLLMHITFLGTGDAGGVPLYGCGCRACERARVSPAHRRRNCSALVEEGPTRILIDAGLTDLTERFAPGWLSAIVLTHFHPDHVQGLLHLRWGMGARISVYCPPDAQGCADLYQHPGLLDFRRVAKHEPFVIGGLTLTPLPLIHSKATFGYAIEAAASGQRLAYLTDTVGLPPATEAWLARFRPGLLALDCTEPPRPAAPRNHNDLDRALRTCRALAPAQSWLTHLSHEMDLWLMEHPDALPPGVQAARDGLVARYEWPEHPHLFHEPANNRTHPNDDRHERAIRGSAGIQPKNGS